MSAPDELVEEVLGRYAGAPNERLKEVMESAVRHLHAFVREINLQRDEWFEAIKFLTATGQMCDETRQEWILLSDTLGVSTLVEMLTYSGIDGQHREHRARTVLRARVARARQRRVDARRPRRG